MVSKLAKIGTYKFTRDILSVLRSHLIAIGVACIIVTIVTPLLLVSFAVISVSVLVQKASFFMIIIG